MKNFFLWGFYHFVNDDLEVVESTGLEPSFSIKAVPRCWVRTPAFFIKGNNTPNLSECPPCAWSDGSVALGNVRIIQFFEINGEILRTSRTRWASI